MLVVYSCIIVYRKGLVYLIILSNTLLGSFPEVAHVNVWETVSKGSFRHGNFILNGG